MPRNPSGDFTLVAGNPVVTGTPISSAVNNNTNSDIATALTDSLSRTGKGGMLVAFQLADGTSVAPALTFTTEPTTGLFKAGASQYAVVVQGAIAFVMNGPTSATPNLAVFNLPLVQQIVGVNYAVLNRKSDYVGASNTEILGQWEFTYDLTTFKGPQIEGSGGMLFNDSPAQTSGIVRLVSVAPAPGSGKPGDIWLVV